MEGEKTQRANVSHGSGQYRLRGLNFFLPPSLLFWGGRFFFKKTPAQSLTGRRGSPPKPPRPNDAKIDQTHPQWTSDGKYIIFRSNRARGGSTQAFAINEVTGEIVQLTDGPGTGTGSLNVARKSNRLYFFRGGRDEPANLIELNLDPLFADSEAGRQVIRRLHER